MKIKSNKKRDRSGKKARIIKKLEADNSLPGYGVVKNNPIYIPKKKY